MTSSGKCRIFPQFIPNEWRRDPKRRAELLLYDRLKEQLSEDWTVFYDVAWLARVRDKVPEDGQTDFIIIHPSFGLLLVELKGGRISYSAEMATWTSIDAAGKTWEIKDAFKQVERSKYALRNKLASIPSLARENFSFFDAVAFPDVRVGEVALRLDAPPQVVIDCDDLLSIEKKMLSVMNYLSAGSARALEPNVIELLINLLAPSIELVSPLAAQFDQEYEQILRLTGEQFNVLSGFRSVPRLGVRGCAGSGKTILAVQKAQNLAEEGFRTLLTCYNRHLADYLTKAVGKHSLLTICTFHQLCSKSAKQSSLKLPEIGSLPQQDLDAEYALVLCEAMSCCPELQFDAIVVDEAQDFYKDWWDALELCLRDGKRSILYAFLDDNQKVYKRESGLPDGMVLYDLFNNIRNAQPIFRCTEHYYGASGRRIEPRGPAGRPVEWLKYTDRNDLQQCLSRILRRLIEVEQVNPKDITVLTPKSLEERSVLLSLKLSEQIQLVKHTERKRSHEIGCSTIKAFKGLENNVVIVTELDDELATCSEVEQINELYVAVSRPRNHLIMLSNHRFKESLLAR